MRDWVKSTQHDRLQVAGIPHVLTVPVTPQIHGILGETLFCAWVWFRAHSHCRPVVEPQKEHGTERPSCVSSFSSAHKTQGSKRTSLPPLFLL